nr:hypothetical protein [Gammaproteobacteria bacterium]
AQIEHGLRGFSAAGLLYCMLLLGPSVGLAAGGGAESAAAADATPAATPDPTADSDEIEDSEDGSAALGDTSRQIGTKVLLPVTVDEEQSLLGDWGDSENED